MEGKQSVTSGHPRSRVIIQPNSYKHFSPINLNLEKIRQREMFTFLSLLGVAERLWTSLDSASFLKILPVGSRESRMFQESLPDTHTIGERTITP